MIDIMDRNLYERANDCRWWALAPELRRLLAQRQRSAEDLKQIESILNEINRLYTVYTRLVVFDNKGVIIGESKLNSDDVSVVGQTVDSTFLSNTLALRTSADYCVSPFVSTDMYNNAPTYIYGAAIRNPENVSAVVGGIGIVFDSTPQFKAILESTLPKRDGAFAMFVDRNAKLIASSRGDHKVGAIMPLDQALLKQANGVGTAKIIQFENEYMLVGATTSFGYREYKNSGDYNNDIIAIVMLPIGPAATAKSRAKLSSISLTNAAALHQQSTREFATFLIDDHLYALPAHVVVQAADATAINSTTTLKPLVMGMLPTWDDGHKQTKFIPVVDTALLLGHIKKTDANDLEGKQVIIISEQGRSLGLYIDSLHDVLEFGIDQIETAPQLPGNGAIYVTDLIKAAEKETMISVIDPEQILRKVFGAL